MTRNLLILFTTIIWFAGSIWWYTCKIKQVCMKLPKVETPTVKDIAKEYGPLVFKWKDANSITNDKFPAYKLDLLKQMTDDNTLEIVGHYYADEPKPANFENMGLARAEDIKNLFIDKIPANRIRTSSRLMGNASEAIKNDLFESARFRWVDGEEKIVELDESALIYFNFNSTKRIRDAEVEDYLQKVAEKLKKSKQNVTLVGHTDNIGGDALNDRLGKRRADAISSLLKRYGVSSSQITTSSRGERQPIATNSTQDGRDRNRRVELTIN